MTASLYHNNCLRKSTSDLHEFISGVVVESRELWFADDNGLTKELCADPQENEDEQPEINEPCCACDEAKYEVCLVL